MIPSLPRRNEIRVVDADLHLKEVVLLPDNEFNNEMEIIGFIDVQPDLLPTLKVNFTLIWGGEESGFEQGRSKVRLYSISYIHIARS